MQTAREGRAIDLVTLLADLEAAGDITREPDEIAFDSVDHEDGNPLDSEIELADDDQPHLVGWDDERSNEPSFTPAHGEELSRDSAELPMRIELLVANGKCRVSRPAWMRAQPLTSDGLEFLDEIGRRFDVLGTIADWLSERRGEFLLTPDPWFLGVEALDEMRRGFASVSPGSFLALTGLNKLVSCETFSRHTTDSFLVWEDGTLPLDFVFGREARMAWVAGAVFHLSGLQGSTLTAPILEGFEGVTVPRTKKERDELDRIAFDHLDFGRFIAKANMMADTKWADVLAAYRAKLLREKP